MLLRRKASPIKVHGEHARRSRHGPTALEVACQTRDELRVAPHECTTAQLRTTTPGSTPARPRGKMRLCWKLVPGRDSRLPRPSYVLGRGVGGATAPLKYGVSGRRARYRRGPEATAYGTGRRTGVRPAQRTRQPLGDTAESFGARGTVYFGRHAFLFRRRVRPATVASAAVGVRADRAPAHF